MAKVSKEYYRDWYQKNKDRIKGRKKEARQRARAKLRAIVDVAKQIPCKDCGVQYPPYVMTFDHLGDKKFNVADLGGVSIDALKAEIAKCQVVCANCHAERTHRRRIDKG